MADPSDPLRVAAFDFDGTLTRRDSLLPYLVSVRGRTAVALAMARLAPRLGLMAIGRGDRDDTKERLISRLLAGYPLEEAATAGQAYAAELVPDLRPDVLERVDWHREAGHRVVIVSASPTIYLDALGELLGFDAVLATRLEVGPDGLLTGRLVGGNCRGAEKVVRLREWLDDREPVETWAYGDSSGDDELLAFADHPTRV